MVDLVDEVSQFGIGKGGVSESDEFSTKTTGTIKQAATLSRISVFHCNVPRICFVPRQENEKNGLWGKLKTSDGFHS